MLLKISVILLGYLCGCVNGAYYVGKIMAKEDIRELGSTNAGARNAGRVFGKSAFIYTVIIDALKTVIPLLVALYFFGENALILGTTAIAILMGHAWPVQLQFRGGKGVVVYLATALILAPVGLIIVGLTVLIGLQIKKNFTIVGLVGLITIPIYLLLTSMFKLSGIFFVMIVIVILLHRKGD